MSYKRTKIISAQIGPTDGRTPAVPAITSGMIGSGMPAGSSQVLSRSVARTAARATVNGEYLGAPRFREMWEAFDDRGIVASVHPDGIRDLWFQVSGLRIVVSHRGGFLPHCFGRLERNVTNMPDSVRNIRAKPCEYLTRYYDTCVYDPSTLDARSPSPKSDHTEFLMASLFQAAGVAARLGPVLPRPASEAQDPT